MPILSSHKYGVFYLEHCRVVASDTRLSFIKSDQALEKYFALPHLNLAILLLGPGTSMTQQAARLMASEGVLVGFTAGGAVPLFLASQSEYRPTEYLQSWISWWPDEAMRLKKAKTLQALRIQNVEKAWSKWFGTTHTATLHDAGEAYLEGLEKSGSVSALLGFEANYTKTLYKTLARHFKMDDFKRTHRSGESHVNQLLDQGNYLAYGFASVALWGLGIPPSLAVIHGKTRRGALVFDIADVYKDALVLPTAFEAAHGQLNASEFRKELIDRSDRLDILPKLFNILKNISTSD